MTTSRVVLVGLVAFVGAAALGCNGGISVPKTVPTSGTVLLKNGKPAEGVKVTLHPKFDMGSFQFKPNGITDKEGRFKLSTAAPDDGAPPGEYAITFELLRGGSDKQGQDIEVDVWKGKYANPETAQTVTVGSSATTFEPFKLD